MNRFAHAEKLGVALLAYIAFFALFAALALRISLSENYALLFFSAWFGACVGIVLVFFFSRSSDVPGLLCFQILIGIALDVSCNFAAGKLGEDAATETSRLALVAFANIGLIVAATSLGLLVARGLRRPDYLIMAAIVGALTDIFSVYAGPSKHILSSATFPYVSYQWGVIGQGGVIPCVGAGDFVFLALYFYGVRRFGLDDRKTLVAMAAAFALGYLALLLSPGGIPALPFMSALLLAVHGRELKLQMRAA